MRLCQILLISSAALLAQQPSEAPLQADPVIRLNVRQVLVPVIATDRKGHYAAGLRASDFRVFEDGVAQEIAAFSTDTAASLEDAGALAQPSSGADTPPSAHKGPRRTYVICIDILHSSPADAERVRAALEGLFHDEKSQNSQYVLVGIGRQLRVLQTATSNPLEVLLKIRGSGFQSVMTGSDAGAFSTELNNLRIRMEDFCKRCPCGLHSSQRSCDSEIDTLKQSVDAEAARWVALNTGMAEQFRSAVEELGKIPTGRTLILVSAGFNLDPVAEFYGVVAGYLPGSPQFRLQDQRKAAVTLQPALQAAANRNVIIYGIDARGGYTPSLASSGPMDASGPSGGRDFQSGLAPRVSQATVRNTPLESAPGSAGSRLTISNSAVMAQMAQSTGGVYFHDYKDLLKVFRAAFADGREYYVLAYVPKNAAATGGFRRITVEAPGKDLTIRSKAGYWVEASAQ